MELKHLLEKLRERHIYRVAVIYAAAAWLLIQVGDVVVDSFTWPLWIMQAVIAASIAAFPLVLLAAWIYGARASEDDAAQPPAQSTSTLADKPSLVVLPFNCYSDNAADNWLTDALVEDLITLLARIPGFFVVSRNTAFTYRNRGADERQLGEELGVRYVVEGSVRRTDTGFRVAAQLVSTESGIQLWSDHYERDIDTFSQLHDDLCREISQRLGAELTRAEMTLAERKPPAEWTAWELFQKAKGKLQFGGWSSEAFEETVSLLRKALELEPDFAAARAYLALILALGHWSRMYPDERPDHAEVVSHVDQAIDLAPSSSEVLGYAGCALSDLGFTDRGIPIIERAIELNPSNSQARAALGASKVVAGNLAEGIEDLTYAIKLSPSDPGLAPWSSILSLSESAQGNWQKGLEWSSLALKADPRYYPAHLAVAAAKLLGGDTKAAQAALDQAKHVNPDVSEESVEALIGHKNWSMMAAAGLSIPEAD